MVTYKFLKVGNLLKKAGDCQILHQNDEAIKYLLTALEVDPNYSKR